MFSSPDLDLDSSPAFHELSFCFGVLVLFPVVLSSVLVMVLISLFPRVLVRSKACALGTEYHPALFLHRSCWVSP